MKIVNITTKPYHIELKTPFITALRRVEYVESLQVFIHIDNDMQGIGSAPPTKAITGEDMQSLQDSIEHIFRPFLLGKEVTFELLRELYEFKTPFSSAKASLDMALYDLLSQKTQKPLYELLGAKEKTSLKTDITISLNDPQKMVSDANDALKNGFDILKIKLGSIDGQDMIRVKEIAKIAKNATLLLDINQAYSYDQSIDFIDQIRDLDIALIEQPVKADDVESLRMITSQSPFAILADEAVFSFEDAQKIIESKSAHMINIKLMKCGGIYGATLIAELCRENGIKCMIGSMLEDPVSIAAAFHFAIANTDVISFVDLDSVLLYKELPSDSKVMFEKNLISLI